jgi:hypothetical protein
MKNLNIIKSIRRRRRHPVDPDCRRGHQLRWPAQPDPVDPDCRRGHPNCKQRSRRKHPDCKKSSRRRRAVKVSKAGVPVYNRGRRGVPVKDGFIKDSTYYEYRDFIERITREYLQRLLEREERIARGEPLFQNIVRPPIIRLPGNYRVRSNAIDEENKDDFNIM